METQTCYAIYDCMYKNLLEYLFDSYDEAKEFIEEQYNNSFEYDQMVVICKVTPIKRLYKRMVTTEERTGAFDSDSD